MRIAHPDHIRWFLDANGLTANIWYIHESHQVILHLPALPWWAWIRRRYQEAAIRRLKAAVPISWKVAAVEAATTEEFEAYDPMFQPWSAPCKEGE